MGGVAEPPPCKAHCPNVEAQGPLPHIQIPKGIWDLQGGLYNKGAPGGINAGVHQLNNKDLKGNKDTP